MDLSAYLSSKGVRTFKAAGSEVTAHCWWCDDGEQQGQGQALPQHRELDVLVQALRRPRAARRCCVTSVTSASRRGPDQDPAARRRAGAATSPPASRPHALAHEMLIYLRSSGPRPRTGPGRATCRRRSIVARQLRLRPAQRRSLCVLPPSRVLRVKSTDIGAGILLTAPGRGLLRRLPDDPLRHATARRADPGQGARRQVLHRPRRAASASTGLDDLDGADDVIITEGEYDCLVLRQHLRTSPDERVRKIAVVGLAGAQRLQGLRWSSTSTASSGSTSGSTPTRPASARRVKLKELLGTRARIVRAARRAAQVRLDRLPAAGARRRQRRVAPGPPARRPRLARRHGAARHRQRQAPVHDARGRPRLRAQRDDERRDQDRLRCSSTPRSAG